ncbi:hypothetical protein [Clostridium thermobutyricum]|uniref:hypothetical protein n=1 Tax=Clostridium thermobutyricum TaxID=29372 RepID=UPI0029439335|nr:hypothetical protein [Clostridium thermobutyricum]
MSKKIIGVIIAATLAVSLVACGEKKEDSNNSVNNIENSRSVGDNAKTKNLQGAWASKEYTYNSFKDESTKLTTKVEDLSKEFGLDYKNEEKVEDVDGLTANVKSVYLDNKNPEENKLESMQFSTQYLGKSQEGGKFMLKESLKFNGEKAIKEGNFNLGDTSLAKYAAILTEEPNRDYSELNKKIMDIIKSDKPEGVIEDSVNGLHEELAVSKDYIVYTLTTKEFKFQKEISSGV